MWESRVAPLSGVMFALLLVAGFVVAANTDFMPPEREVVAYLEDGPLRVMTGAYLVLLAAAALTWFSASLYQTLRRFDDDDGRLSVLALSGGVLAAAMLALEAAATVAAAERVWIAGSIESGAAAALLDVAGIAVGNGVPLGLAVLVGATSATMLRVGRRYRWGGLVSALIALGLISPYSWLILAAGVVWVPVVAIWMYRDQPVDVLAMS